MSKLTNHDLSDFINFMDDRYPDFRVCWFCKKKMSYRFSENMPGWIILDCCYRIAYDPGKHHLEAFFKQ